MQNSVANPQGENPHAEPHKFSKRIGSTVYNVSVYSNQSAKETAEDKILRLIKNEVLHSA